MTAAVEVVLAAIYPPPACLQTVLLIDANAEDEQLFREEPLPDSLDLTTFLRLQPKACHRPIIVLVGQIDERPQDPGTGEFPRRCNGWLPIGTDGASVPLRVSRRWRS